MIDFIKQNKYLSIGAVVVLVGLLFYFSGGSVSQPLLSSTGVEQSTETQQLLALLSSINTIKLDNSIFSDPVFKSLTDFGVVIAPQDFGRNNPFAPLNSPSRTKSVSSPVGQ